MTELSDKLESDEFLYYMLYHYGILSNKYYAVTDKKLIKYDYKTYWQAPLSDIVAIGDPIFNPGDQMFNQSSVTLKVQTFTETVTLDFGETMDYNFYNALRELWMIIRVKEKTSEL